MMNYVESEAAIHKCLKKAAEDFIQNSQKNTRQQSHFIKLSNLKPAMLLKKRLHVIFDVFQNSYF